MSTALADRKDHGARLAGATLLRAVDISKHYDGVTALAGRQLRGRLARGARPSRRERLRQIDPDQDHRRGRARRRRDAVHRRRRLDEASADRARSKQACRSSTRTSPCFPISRRARTSGCRSSCTGASASSIAPKASRWRGVRSTRSASRSTSIGTVADLPVSQKQLVAIARALVHDARLLIMDEPTTALTHREVQHLFAIIRRLAAGGMSFIFVSHKLAGDRRNLRARGRSSQRIEDARRADEGAERGAKSCMP